MGRLLDFLLGFWADKGSWKGIGEAFSGLTIPKTWKRPEGGGMPDLPKDAAIFAMENSKCPYCLAPLYDGPQGGAAQNFYCERVDDCNSAINLSEMIPGWGQFIGECPPHFIDFIHETYPELAKFAGEPGR